MSDPATPAVEHTRPPTHDGAAPDAVSDQVFRSVPGPTASPGLLPDPRLHGRGNGVVREATLLHLQRTQGNRAVARLLHHRPAPLPVQRMVKLTFTSDQTDSQEDVAPLDDRIEIVEATRDAGQVGVEDKGVKNQQRAHVTSHTVTTQMLVRLLDQKNWIEAWQVLKREFEFLKDLLARWYQEVPNNLRTNALTRNRLPVLIQAQIDHIQNEQLARGGHSIANPIWFSQTGTDVSSRKYWDHQPTPLNDGIALTDTVKQWVLHPTRHRQELENVADQWLLLRGQMPWTSVDTDSTKLGDVAGPGKVDEVIANNALDANLSAGELKKISQAILKTFEFFPTSLTQARPLEIAANLAARHVVEHFEYHPGIKTAWRDPIAARFLVDWRLEIKQLISDNKPPPKSSKKRTNESEDENDERRDPQALEALDDDWGTVTNQFDTAYASFKQALV